MLLIQTESGPSNASVITCVITHLSAPIGLQSTIGGVNCGNWSCIVIIREGNTDGLSQTNCHRRRSQPVPVGAFEGVCLNVYPISLNRR